MKRRNLHYVNPRKEVIRAEGSKRGEGRQAGKETPKRRERRREQSEVSLTTGRQEEGE